MRLEKSWPEFTVHTLVKNEDRWIWYALRSIIDYAAKIIIYDTGSIDQTIPIIKSIKSSKISFFSKSIASRQDIVALRQEQLQSTRTPWFMVLDGDEIWPQKNLEKLLNTANKTKAVALFNRTRNCVDNVYHYLPESKGRYQIKDKVGHLNIRLIRNLPGLKLIGAYPLEAYTLNNQPIQNSAEIEFVDTWYLHTTHLPRSTNFWAEITTLDRLKKRKFFGGIKMAPAELPEVFFYSRPKIVPQCLY